MLKMSKELFDEVISCPERMIHPGRWMVIELPNGNIFLGESIDKEAVQIKTVTTDDKIVKCIN